MFGDRFIITDNTVNHIDSILIGITDPFVKNSYVGLLSVVAVCSYELTIKDVFIDFSSKKHKVLGNFASNYFDRINGRIKTRILKKEYLTKFGNKYLDRFKRKIKVEELKFLRTTGKSITSSYNNIIEWRNQFAHEGKIPTYVTYNDAKEAYDCGKEVLRILNETMRY